MASSSGSPNAWFERLFTADGVGSARHFDLWFALVRDAGWRHTWLLAALAALGNVLEVTGLGVAVAVLLGAGSRPFGGLVGGLPLRVSALLVIVVLLVRTGLQAYMGIAQEQLRSSFTDRLRKDLLAQVVFASSARLAQIGRGDLLGLVLSDISRSVMALDQGIRCAQAGVALAIYGAGVLVVGHAQAWPLVIGLVAAAAAGLLQRSGAWSLGRLQTSLNGALHRTVGDGLHGLKAVRAAAAEQWLLDRFNQETLLFRRVLKQTVRRQALFACLRDGLVLAVVGVWLGLGLHSMDTATITTTLLLAYRASGSLGAVINARRLCLGALPGYEKLQQLRQQLGTEVDIRLNDPLSSQAALLWPTPPLVNELPFSALEPLAAVRWQQVAIDDGQVSTLDLQPGQLTVVVGPSGSGKTTLLDGFAGLQGEERSQWLLQPVSPITRACTLSGRQGVQHWRKFVAYAPQDSILFEGSLRENLLLGQGNLSLSRDQEIEAWLECLDLAHLISRPSSLERCLNLALDCFSGGEIHRLGLIRAWLLNRPVEILDEPTAFLDARSASLVRRVLLERSKERLVVVASHDPALVAMASRVIHLSPAGLSNSARVASPPEALL